MSMPASTLDLILMRVIDELHLEYPSLGLRRLTKGSSAAAAQQAAASAAH
jgi:hypothetical protein